MTPEQLALLADARLSTDARVVGLWVSEHAADWTEVDVAEFEDLLSADAGKDRRQRAVRQLLRYAWIERKPGGRGHNDLFRFSSPETPHLSDSSRRTPQLNEQGAEDSSRSPRQVSDSDRSRRQLNADSSRSRQPLSAAPFSHTSSSVHPPSGARAQVPGAAPAGEPPAAELEQLRTYLGDHAGAVDRFMAAAAHPRIWAGAVYGAFGPTGSRQWAWRGVPEEERPAILANALDDFAQEKTPYNNRHFEGFVVNEARHWKRRQQDDPDSAGPDGDAGAEAESEYSHLGG